MTSLAKSFLRNFSSLKESYYMDPEEDPEYDEASNLSAWSRDQIAQMPPDQAQAIRLERYARWLSVQGRQEEADAILSELAAIPEETRDSWEKAMYDRKRNEPAKGPYSGLTRSELARSGTSEPDWY